MCLNPPTEFLFVIAFFFHRSSIFLFQIFYVACYGFLFLAGIFKLSFITLNIINIIIILQSLSDHFSIWSETHELLFLLLLLLWSCQLWLYACHCIWTKICIRIQGLGWILQRFYFILFCFCLGFQITNSLGTPYQIKDWGSQRGPV